MESLMGRKATINMKCIDEESFKWSVMRALNPITKSSDRVTKVLREQSKSYNWEGVSSLVEKSTVVVKVVKEQPKHCSWGVVDF